MIFIKKKIINRMKIEAKYSFQENVVGFYPALKLEKYLR